MRTTISLPDKTFEELLRLSGEANRTRAVQVAVEFYNRRMKLEQLRALRGSLDIAGTEALDEAELKEQAQRER